MAYEPIKTITSPVIPIPVDNIDTDQIIPARFLKATSREAEFGKKLFSDWRYTPSGVPNPEFALNQYAADSRILLAGGNFGCGSSREHAAWALYDYGFRVVLARSFADIFKTNALNNGILVITLPEDIHQDLLNEILQKPESLVEVDLPGEYLSFRNGQARYGFHINPFRSQCLQNGLDLLDFLVARKEQITKFEQKTFSN